MDRREAMQAIGGVLAGVVGADALAKEETPKQLGQPAAAGIPKYMLNGPLDDGNLCDELKAEMPERLAVFEHWQASINAGIECPWTTLDIAMLLENQRLLNQSFPWLTGPDDALFKRMSFPLTWQTFGESFLVRKLVNCWTSMRPSCYVYWREGKKVVAGTHGKTCYLNTSERSIKEQTHHLEMATKKWGTYWSEDTTDIRSERHADAESELCAILANQIQREATWHVLKDLMRIATHGETIPAENITQFTDLHKKSTIDWIVTSRRVAELMGLKVAKTDGVFNMSHAGKVHNKDVYILDQMGYGDSYDCKFRDEHSVLVGHKGKDFFDGAYTFVNYVPFTCLSPVMDYETGEIRRSLMTRFNSAVRPDALKYYHTFKVKF